MPVKKAYDSLALRHGWKAGEAQTLNLSKKTHWDFISEQYQRAEVTKKSAPKLFSALSKARTQGSGPRPKAVSGDALVPMNAIVSLGFSSKGTFASAFSAIPGGTTFTSLILELVDPADGTVLNTASISEFGVGEYLPIEVKAGRPAGDDIEAIFTVSYQTGPGRPITQSMRMTVSDKADGAPVVGEPVKRTTGDPDLRIALYAWRQKPGLDYWYLSLPTDPDLRLPLVGTQRFHSPIAKPFDPAISLYLIAPERGGVAMAKTKSLEALRKSLKVSGNKLAWNMPWSANPLRDRSVHFGSAAWGEEQVLLVFTIDVLTKKADFPVRTVITSGGSKAAGVAPIPKIQYSWR
jgi:hypothetical protein